uniref:Uncharacterized protein n=1 Tax=Lepeophtheirus salmonis TaxID=72036 RepID=A0A0K2UN08_LEPSM
MFENHCFRRVIYYQGRPQDYIFSCYLFFGEGGLFFFGIFMKQISKVHNYSRKIKFLEKKNQKSIAIQKS